MESITLILFCLMLLLCLVFDVSILYALAAGLILFTVYGIRKGFSLKAMLTFSLNGIKTVKNILITFFLIGMLTALWRAAGTIPVIVCFAARLIRPSIYLMMTFLLNCMISFLTGTAFGTAATMGVICSTMGASLGISPVFIGGAVLSGVFFGDRCSPVSTSALLTATLTGTDIFSNIRGMLRTAALPFLLTCVIYLLTGIFLNTNGEIPDLAAIFGEQFDLSALCALPAVLLLILSLCKVNVKLAMTASIAAALPICLFVQHTPLSELPHLLFSGFQSDHAAIASMLNGGGITSMLKVAAIVCLSSAYSDIFRSTGLLEGIKSSLQSFAQRTTTFTAILLTSILTGMIACNQTLSIMLTDQLTRDLEPDQNRLALALEDTAVVVSPLIPWCIAGAVPLATVGAPTLSVAFACFLYLLPLCRLIHSILHKKKQPNINK